MTTSEFCKDLEIALGEGFVKEDSDHIDFTVHYYSKSIDTGELRFQIETNGDETFYCVQGWHTLSGNKIMGTHEGEFMFMGEGENEFSDVESFVDAIKNHHKEYYGYYLKILKYWKKGKDKKLQKLRDKVDIEDLLDQMSHVY